MASSAASRRCGLLRRAAAPSRCAATAVRAGFLRVVLVVRAGADAGRNFLPVGRLRARSPARPRAGRHADRGDGRAVRPDRRPHPRRSIPPDQIAHGRRQYRPAGQRHQPAYSNSGSIGPQDGDILVTLKEGHQPTAGYVQPLRRRCPTLSRLDLLVPARRHHQPDPEFRRAGADRRPGHRPRRRQGEGLCAGAGGQDARHRRHRRRPPPAGDQLSRTSTSTSIAAAPTASASPRTT